MAAALALIGTVIYSSNSSPVDSTESQAKEQQYIGIRVSYGMDDLSIPTLIINCKYNRTVLNNSN